MFLNEKEILMTQGRFYINTMGCQMNVYDSSKIAAILTFMGYRPSKSFNNADVVIINTCTIRAKARQKATSFLGRLAVRKKKNPDMIIGVGGCVAQHEGQSLLNQFPYVDIVFGTQALPRLPGLIQAVLDQRLRLVDTDLVESNNSPEQDRSDIPANNFGGQYLPDAPAVSEFVTIIRGCDNFCTYCVVPHVRGREASRSPEDILQEVRHLVEHGTREVTLLGQNVNSYGKKEGLCSFAELLARVNAVDGLARIRFATSHPKDLSPELARAFASLDKLCNHCHLPVQSGSSRVLKRMNRKYTREDYMEKIDWLRQARPDIAVSTDIIVGFPGETEDDFEQTVDLLQEIGFDSIFAFMYSDREVAPASKFSGKIAEDEKNRRLTRMLAVQSAISRKKNKACVGTTECVLVEGLSKSVATNSSQAQWTGRTTTNRIVNFTPDTPTDNQSANDLDEALLAPGCIVQVKIEDGYAHSLLGTAVKIEKKSMQAGDIHAA